MLVRTDVARARPGRRRTTTTTFGALFLSLAFVVPTALLGLASPAAAATLNAPDRASVPAEINSSEAHALPGDATDVRIDMTENDGLDVIVAASGGAVAAPGVGTSGAPAVLFHQTAAGEWEVETGCRVQRSLDPAPSPRIRAIPSHRPSAAAC